MLKKVSKFLIYLYIFFIISLLSAWSVFHILNYGEIIPKAAANYIINFASFPSKIFHHGLGHFDEREIVNDEKELSRIYQIPSKEGKLSFILSTFTKNDSLEVKCLNTSDYSTSKRWVISEAEVLKYADEEHKKIPAKLLHPLMLKDSSLIFTCYTLFRMNKNNSLKWINNSRVFHHAIEIDGDSTIWTGSVIKGNKYFNYGNDTLSNEALCRVDIKTGKINFEKSVAEILVENGYISLLQIGKFDSDIIHLNDIQPIFSNSKYWKKGDLFVSLRHRNTVFLYRPSTNKILWLKTGPWLAQHDVDVVDNKTIMVFGNDILRGRKDYFVNGHNDIYFYDFEKDSVYTPYTKMMKKLHISTPSQGRCDFLPNGDLFIDETDNGKLYVISKDSVKMKYVERVDAKHIKMFSWVRPIFN